MIVGIAVALALAFLVAPYASSQPDGLEKAAAEMGIDTGVVDHALANGPLADYAIAEVDNPALSTGLAGIVGVTVTLGVCLGLFGAMRFARRKRAPHATAT